MASSWVETASIRPRYRWPQPRRSLASQCSEEGCILVGVDRRRFGTLFSGSGPEGPRVAVKAHKLLTGAISAQWLQKQQQQQQLPSTLQAAFQQCDQQLQQQPAASAAAHLQQQADPAISLCGNGTSSSESCSSALVVALDQQQHKLVVASAGSCKAVLARCAPKGELTVMELTPRHALGHDPTETARLDAAGSTILYHPAAAHLPKYPATPAANSTSCSDGAVGAAATAAANVKAGLQHEPVLLGPNGQVLHGITASRMLGLSPAATAAGIICDPVVTTWRLSGSEAFVVLGSPGLWQAMNSAEVVDYVAAVLAACRAAGIPGCKDVGMVAAEAGEGSEPPQQQSLQSLVADVLTLEAQERLKLQLMDSILRLCPGSCSYSHTAAEVPDVSAVVLLLDPNAPLRPVYVNKQQLGHELAVVRRACCSNAEALAVQAAWCSDKFDTAVTAPPAPAVSCLLPVLTVSGYCWPASYWLASDAVSAIAATSPTPLSFEGLTRATTDGIDVQNSSSSSSGSVVCRSSSNMPAAAPKRTPSFALNSRLSCELDLGHKHGSQGTCCDCLAAECSNSNIAAAEPDTPTSEQSIIVHKVRLTGSFELESLLFGTVTTSRPDTTVARILWPNSSGGSFVGQGPLGGFSNPLAGPVSNHLGRSGMERLAMHRVPKRSASVSIAGQVRQKQYDTSSSGKDRVYGGSSSSSYTSLHAAAAAPDSQHNWVGEFGASRVSNAGSAGDLGFAQLHVEPWVQQQQQYQQQQHPRGSVKKARSYQALSALQVATLKSSNTAPVKSLPGGWPTAIISSVNLLQSGHCQDPASSNGSMGVGSFRSAFNVPPVGCCGHTSLEPNTSVKVDPASTPQALVAAAGAANADEPSVEITAGSLVVQQPDEAAAAAAGLSASRHVGGWDTVSKPQGIMSSNITDGMSHTSQEAAHAMSYDRSICSEEGKACGGIFKGRIRGAWEPSSGMAAAAAAAAPNASAAAADAGHSNSHQPFDEDATGDDVSGVVSAFAFVGFGTATTTTAVDTAHSSSDKDSCSNSSSRDASSSGSSSDSESPRTATACSILDHIPLDHPLAAVQYHVATKCSCGPALGWHSYSTEANQQQQQQRPPRNGSNDLAQLNHHEQVEGCVRGGRDKASRLRPSFSTSDLSIPLNCNATAAPTVGSNIAASCDAGSRLSLPTHFSWSHDATSLAGAAERHGGGETTNKGGWCSMPGLLGLSGKQNSLVCSPVGSQVSLADMAAAAEVKAIAAAAAAAVLGPQPATSPVATSAEASSSDHALLCSEQHEVQSAQALRPVDLQHNPFGQADNGSFSSCCSPKSDVADGAVHGGELGEESLEGQMHGGRSSSSSLSLSSSAKPLVLSQTSSAATVEDSSFAGISRNTSANLQLLTNSYSSMALGGLDLKPFSPILLRQPVKRASSAAVLGSSAGLHGLSHVQQQQQVGLAAKGSPSSRGLYNVSQGLQQQQHPYLAASGRFNSPFQHQQQLQQAYSGTKEESDWQPNTDLSSKPAAIEVLTMPSGSFTRVRLAVSAPATAAVGDGGVSCTLEGSRLPQAQGAAGHHLSPPTGWRASCLQQQQLPNSCDEGITAAGSQSTYRVLSLRNPIKRSATAGAAAGVWTTSRIWGGDNNPSSSDSSSAASQGLRQTTSRTGGSAGAGLLQQSHSTGRRHAASTAFDTDAGASSFVGAAGTSSDSSGSSDAAVPATSLVSLATGKRQNSVQLPTLQESPAATPGSSPQVPPGSCFPLHLQQQQQQLLQHQQQLAVKMGNLVQQSVGQGTILHNAGEHPDLVDVESPNSISGVACVAFQQQQPGQDRSQEQRLGSSFEFAANTLGRNASHSARVSDKRFTEL